MAHPTTARFHTLHALRIKGFATAGALADITARPGEEIGGHLDERAEAGHAQFRDARALWQITTEGREVHLVELAEDLDGFDVAAQLGGPYESFLSHNDTFKQVCTDWQLRDDVPNDHSDTSYDADVIDRLAALHAEVTPVLSGFGAALERLAPYLPRLDDVLARLRGGQSNMFTGVMCGSYHDVWMELHEDLILTQQIDRSAEGSF